jgi:hypothetical protein
MIADYGCRCQVHVLNQRPLRASDCWYNGRKEQAHTLKGISHLERVTIQRRASYLYARSLLKIVVALTVVYAAVGISEMTIDSVLAGILIITLGVAPIITMWLVYLLILWIFRLESRTAVEIGSDGIREMRNSREREFIPWAGVREIELVATVIAGASLRVKGAFSEITISNIDIVITEPLSIREMHRALGRTSDISHLLSELRAAAPHATVRMNKLARHRMNKYEWTGKDTARK